MMSRRPGGVLVAVAVVLALITWPFDALFRLIGRLLGGREREERAARDIAQNSVDRATQLMAALAPDRPDLVGALEGEDDPWNAAINALQDAARIGVIDWRSEPDEMRAALDPMLQRHGAALDWSFLDALEARGDWNAINNENLAPRVGREIAKLGLVLAHVDDSSDSYVMAICTQLEFAQIEGLTIGDDAVRVRRFA